MITEAKEFIVKNYQEETLSLSDVANQVGLSSSHFSTTFKQETGNLFVEFLTSVRMDKAKEMLLFYRYERHHRSAMKWDIRIHITLATCLKRKDVPK